MAIKYSNTCTNTAEQTKGDAAETELLAARQPSHMMASVLIHQPAAGSGLGARGGGGGGVGQGGRYKRKGCAQVTGTR